MFSVRYELKLKKNNRASNIEYDYEIATVNLSAYDISIMIECKFIAKIRNITVCIKTLYIVMGSTHKFTI